MSRGWRGVCETTCEEKTATLEQNNIHPPPKEFPSTYISGRWWWCWLMVWQEYSMQCEAKKPLKRAGALLMTMLLPLCFFLRREAEGCRLPTGKKTPICMHSMKLLSPFFHTIPLRFSAVLVIEAIKVEFSFLFFFLVVWMTMVMVMMLLLACTHFIILFLVYKNQLTLLQPYKYHTTKLQWTYSLHFAILKEYIYIRLKMKRELQGGNKTKPAENSTEELISSSRKKQSFRIYVFGGYGMAIWMKSWKKLTLFSASPA